MLALNSITKNYAVGDGHFTALKGIDLAFERGELVSILGPSGCGKTSLLNIIGGLDHNFQGDLSIDGTSTAGFEDDDWDAYRNHRIGFIFQDYNLISHLTVLENVEMAMVLSGVAKAERVKKSKEMLRRVGLEDQLHKKPELLSGGQRQRVVIARALVDDPDILLADEPTGALDSETSIETLELIKEIAAEKLVIMVTHNTALARKYSSRIVEMSDGVIIKDAENLDKDKGDDQQSMPQTPLKNIPPKDARSTMSYMTAMNLSLKNLLTKSFRTSAVVFAGSIGIIGIALVLSFRNGFSNEMDTLQQNMFTNMPAIKINDGAVKPATDGIAGMNKKQQKIRSDNAVIPYIPQKKKAIHHNTISNDYVSYLKNMDSSWYSHFTMNMGIELNIMTASKGVFLTAKSTQSGFIELYSKQKMLELGNLVYGEYPEDFNEVLLLTDSHGRVNKNALRILGVDVNADEIDYKEIAGKQFVIAYNNDYYQQTATNRFKVADDKKQAYANGLPVTVTGVLRIHKPDNALFNVKNALADGIGYSDELIAHLYQSLKVSHIVTAQKQVDYNVLSNDALTALDKEDALKALGGSRLPNSIDIVPNSSESSALIKTYLDAWNEDKSAQEKIIYTDKAAAVKVKMNTMIDAVAIILIGFATVSLMVSSIMISIITYISVIERTHEIGILRSLGARKKDISRVVNAETAIIGFVAGVIGTGIAFVISMIANPLANHFIAVEKIALLSPVHVISLVMLSVILTVFAGIIPSNIATKKDPVQTLGTTV